ncbi:MAG: pilus assembly protein PilM [Chitinispirillales bacterium]|jgi:Tfp pilus assembly PilM family ATPase|nr:pilus assembly protein PilM [Chitinispirillales bacterium]
MAKKQIFIGVDMDSVSVRGVRLAFDPDKSGGNSTQSAWELLSAAEVNGGNFLDDAQAVSALKNLRENLKGRPSDKVSVCLSGKQTYAVRMDVRKIPEEEMAGMLRLELRKSMPFELSAATIDYQILPTESNDNVYANAGVSVMVSAAADSYLERQAAIYGKAGLPPYHADVLPVSVANAFWAACGDGAAEPEGAVLLLHLGADVCTLVIDGRNAPFFSRAFSFNMSKTAGDDKTADISSSINILADEVTKSAAYYKNTNRINGISSISISGAYASHPALDELTNKTGYSVRVVQTASLVRAEKPLEPGKYDLAIALAMQAA